MATGSSGAEANPPGAAAMTVIAGRSSPERPKEKNRMTGTLALLL
jgi:hypothetical protein